MSRRILVGPVALGLLLAGALASPAEEGKAGDPDSKYAMDLRARKSTEPEFTKDTKKYGVEVYTDGHNRDGIYISERGSLSVVPARLFKAEGGKVKDPLWQHGLTLNVRPAGEKSWDKAKKFGLEVLRDENSGALDRKSTRLNSSHLGISYAVFCLKKKTHKIIDHQALQ